MDIQMARSNPLLKAHASPDPTPILSRELLGLAASFAIVLFLVASLVWWVAGVDPVKSASGKLVGIAGDTILAVLITLVLRKLRAWPLGMKAMLACVLALAASPVSAFVDWCISSYYWWPKPVPIDPTYVAQVIIFSTSELFGWSCLYLALQYSSEVRETERRLAALREEALSAQMQALHYQINPHFLFNTLNSIAGLVEEGANGPAREMVLMLANFLRRTISLDPMTKSSLEDEVALQLDYLGIEKVRFSDRMSVTVALHESARHARVPALLLQPLVENAIKHGIARTPGPAEIKIAASVVENGQLKVWVENSVPPGEGLRPDGLGIGLANVSNRLIARHGAAAKCRIAPTGAGFIRVEITMPFVS